MKTIQGTQGNKVWNFYFPSKRNFNVGGVLMLSFILFTSCLDHQLETVSDIEENFADITAIEVDAGFLPAHYVGNPDLEEVNLDALLRATSGGSKNISYRVVDETLIVTVENKGLGWGRSEGHIIISGPTDMSLQMHSGSGEVHAENVTGDKIHLEVNSGKVSAKNITAQEVFLSASSGELRGENIKGNTIVEASSGKLTIQQLEGNLDAESSSGNMELIGIDGLLNAKLSSGNVNMEQVQALGNVTLSSGKVTGKNVGLSEHTYLKASSGNFSIQTNSNLADFNFEIHAGSGKVKVGESESSGTLKIMNGSTHTIKGEVSSGKIEIFN